MCRRLLFYFPSATFNLLMYIKIPKTTANCAIRLGNIRRVSIVFSLLFIFVCKSEHKFRKSYANFELGVAVTVPRQSLFESQDLFTKNLFIVYRVFMNIHYGLHVTPHSKVFRTNFYRISRTRNNTWYRYTI